ncbi:methyltransferase [Enterococcus phage vB_Efs19_KEN17]
MSKLPFEKDLKEALSKPTLTQRETALTALVEKLQGALVESDWDKLTYEKQYEEAIEVIRGLDEDIADSYAEIESLESDIQNLENELESSEETVEELTEEVDWLSERIEDLESIVESLED